MDAVGFSAPVSTMTTPLAHGTVLHPGATHHVTIARQEGGRRYERSYPVDQLADVLPAVADEKEVFLSVSRFHRWRKIALLAEAGALYADVDFHKVPELAGKHPWQILDYALELLSLAEMPEPSMAIASGRGLYLLWLHSPIPRSSLPRWNDCQRALINVLKPLGADPRARDAARVLRVVGSRHAKAGVLVECLRGPGERRDFKELADKISPVRGGEAHEAEVHDFRVQRATRRPQDRLWTPREELTAASMWTLRLDDLQLLRKEIRWFGELPPGQRDLWMFIAGNAISWITPPQALRRELFQLAREAGGWSDHESKQRLIAVTQRATRAERGEKIEYRGEWFDPRYRFKTATIIEWLEITLEEQRSMRVLIGAEERQRRDRDRKEAERRAKGRMTREEYLAPAQAKRAEANRLRAQGLSLRKIAAQIGASKTEVHRLLKEGNEGVSRVVPYVCAPQGAEDGSGGEEDGVWPWSAKAPSKEVQGCASSTGGAQEDGGPVADPVANDGLVPEVDDVPVGEVEEVPGDPEDPEDGTNGRPSMSREQFVELAATMREEIARMRRENRGSQPPCSGTPRWTRWGVDHHKAAFFFPDRYAR